MHAITWLVAAALAGSIFAAGCGSSDGGSEPPAATPPVAVVPEESRPHDTRTFTTTPATTFAALATATGDITDMATTSRWAGVLGGASYRVEVPATWNGKLVMYAHGFAGTGAALTVDNPQLRRHLVDNGYAWAASSYSKNYYDVRAGVEDTNALALEFNKIAAANARTLAAPSKIYITGISMGGHITGAAIEAETAATAKNKVAYNGALPMCGVMGDTELFNTFSAMQVAAQAVAGVPSYPTSKWSEIAGLVTGTLFSSFPSATSPTLQVTPTATGARYVSVVKNLTGGERPMFDLGLANGGSFRFAYNTFGSDGTLNGILTKNVLDTNSLTYVIDGDAAGSATLNASAQKLTAVADANRLRTDGLRWVPKVNGEFKIPVVSIHTLGDLFVPFNMQQVYQKRVAAKGNSTWLVQRALRGITHCDFTVAEQVDAFEAMVKWERDGVKPLGDDVTTPATVAAPAYGCTHTKNTLGPDDTGATQFIRTNVAPLRPCP